MMKAPPALPWILCLAACACAQPGPPQAILRTPDEALVALEDSAGFGRSWTWERTPSWSAVLTRSEKGSLPLRMNPQAVVRLFILAGSARVRVGSRERLLGAGSFIAVPPSVAYRLRRAGRGPISTLAIYSPDLRQEHPLESPLD